MTKRCYSECKKLTKEKCPKQERCMYCNGKTRKFCRLSTKYKYDSECNITRRFRKKEQIPRTKIASFMKRTKYNRTAHFLKNVCSDSNECITFGKEVSKIKQFFNGFVDFDYMNSNTKSIGKPSNNGFVKEIEYVHRGYVAHAILKSNIANASDNLYYEYLVGQFINKLNRYFPCFLETYGIYKYYNHTVHNHMKNNNVSSKVLKRNLIKKSPESMTFKDACDDAKLIAILIQSIKSKSQTQSLRDAIRNTEFRKYSLLYVLLQVYIPLSILCMDFTHYDLHLDNILVFEPYPGKYIEFKYTLPSGKIITFKSKYVCKIIDYGRCYFNDKDSNMNSYKIHKEVCATKDCDPECGMDAGFSIIAPEDPPGSFYFISGIKHNISHDLRAAYETFKELKRLKTPDNLSNIEDKIQYGIEIKKLSEKKYGTIENLTEEYPKQINNVIDMMNGLIEKSEEPNEIRSNEEYCMKNSVKLGTMEIDCKMNKYMKFYYD
jgi:hypothetical protein